MNLTAAMTAAAPWVGAFAFLTVIVRAAGRPKLAKANHAAFVTWCRVIGGEDPPSAPPRLSHGNRGGGRSDSFVPENQHGFDNPQGDAP